MQRFTALDGLRAIAAYWVLFFHLEIFIAGVTTKSVSQIFAKGYLGVDIFFVLSGFVLAHVYAERADSSDLNYGRFLWARLARIYPLHLITFIALVPVAILNEIWLNSWNKSTTSVCE